MAVPVTITAETRQFTRKYLRTTRVKYMRATRAVIHLENLRHNIGLVRRHIGTETRICMAVKADAYGHGVREIVQTALQAGVESVAVATVEEGVELREAGVSAPILLLGFTTPAELPELVRYALSTVVGAEYQLAALGS
ncbi:MAG TPA: alanine racemase, partial [Spirochaetia bacterium]|nr:alanine racemase [Spirochaetia bacterium]